MSLRKQDLQFALELAQGAAKIVLSHFGKVERLTKTHVAASAEAVTDADRGCSRAAISSAAFAVDSQPMGSSARKSETGTSITFDCP